MSVVTMADVARAAGVSRPTVSMALNCDGKWKISERTRRRVLAVAEAMGYQKNLVARSMVTGRTDVVGLVGFFADTYGAEILHGISEVTGAAGFSLKYFGGESDEEVAANIRRCLGQRVSGVICHLSEISPQIHKCLVDSGLPLVHVDNICPSSVFSSVASDDFKGAVLAVDHLHRLGHRRIAHLSGSPGHLYARIRRDGYLAGLKARRLPFDKSLLAVVDDKVEITDAFRRAILRLLRKSGATAVLCGGDQTAMKVLKVVVEAGVKVPEELSIVGFAGLDYTSWSVPALTTLRQPFSEMGRLSAKLLLSEIGGKSRFKAVRLPVELMERQSTAAPRNAPLKI